jgi:hypothetical protein
MDFTTMNRIDFSVEIKIVKDEKEKRFDLPFLCDDLLWLQLFNEPGLGHTLEVPISNATIKY